MDKRLMEERIMKGLMITATVVVVSALFLIIATIFIKGLPSMSWEMITQVPKGGFAYGTEGGILNAILGSLILGLASTALAFAITLPIVLYLNLYLPKDSRFSKTIRFLFDVLYGVPAIVYGAFGFSLMVLLGLRASLLAGIITIALLVMPILARSMDEVIRLISFELKEASLSLGTTMWETATKVIFRQALPGIMTAILLAFGRGIGDAAAVLFTAGFTDSLPSSLLKPVATLPLAIFFQLGTPFPEVQQRGYASAFVLTILILGINILARFLSHRFTKNVVR